MGYVMEDKREALRLEKQSKLKNYDLETELANVHIAPVSKVLDAGCGSGLLCRFLQKKYDDVVVSGCDISAQRLAEAQKLSGGSVDEFFECDLMRLSERNKKYDAIFNRYVAHHLGEERYQKVLNEFEHCLNPGGKVVVVDIDGILANIGTLNKDLEKMIQTLMKTFDGDVYLGRKIPQMMAKSGFINISWEIQVMDFQNAEREHEIEQFKERFEFGMPLYIKAFGSEIEAKRFQKMFLKELADKNSCMFYNKVICQAEKK